MSDDRERGGATPRPAGTPLPDGEKEVTPAAGDKARPGARGGGLVSAILVPVLSLVAALVIGGLVMVFTNPDTLKAWSSVGYAPGTAFSESWNLVSEAYTALFRSSLGGRIALSETIVNATPLMLAGLSVALAFKAGLFNIGAEGQLLAGGMTAAFFGFNFDFLPPGLHLLVALLAGFAGGAVWGAIPGLLKARTGAHEVITTIMLNFVAINFSLFLLKSQIFIRPGREDPISKAVSADARLPVFFDDLRINWGIVLALAAAAAVWWLLYRSTVGFEFRAVGANPSAAAYAGMSVALTYMLAMALAGGLAGLGGTAVLLGIQYSVFPGFSAGYGFDAIAIALLGRTHPFGVVLAALLFGILRAGAIGMQAATSIPVDIIVVIQALVIAFIAAPRLVREIFRIRAQRVAGAEALSKSWAT